jgi:hypothetical protein
MSFYFRWSNQNESTWQASYAVEQESVYSIDVSHKEGEYPVASVVITNPRVGLLGPGRKQWAWIGQDSSDSAGVEALFFGRLTGVPTQIAPDLITVTFRARPDDVQEQKEALAAALKVRPYWDPIFIRPELRDDPDTALESRTQLWHFDRLGPVVSVSDIIDAEDGNVTFSKSDYFTDSLGVAIAANPLKRVRVEADVNWIQKARGDVTVTRSILDAFEAAGTRHRNVVSSFTGAGLFNDWPKFNADIGSGWRVKRARIKRVDGKRYPKVWAATQCQYATEPVENTPDFGVDDDGNEVTNIFRNVTHTTTGAGQLPSYRYKLFDPVDNDAAVQNNANRPVTLRVGLFEFEIDMSAKYDVERQKSERLIFTLRGDVQNIYTESDDSEVEVISLSSNEIAENIDSDGTDSVSPIRDQRRSQFFTTSRGLQAIDFLLSVARTRMRNRARAAQITFAIPFDAATRLSCRKSATVYSDALPGGVASGKVVSYGFTADGEGNQIGYVTIACCVGRGDLVVGSSGTAGYVQSGYVQSGYVQRAGVRYLPFDDELYYEPPTDAPNDDGVDFFDMHRTNNVISCTVTGGETQQAAVLSQSYRLIADALDALNAVKTEVSLVMRPLQTGPFSQTYHLVTSDLMLPKTIEFEA